MIHGHRIVAITPSGRRRFMEVLARYVLREMRRGLVDEWFVYDNCYNQEDSAYTRALAEHPGVRVVGDPGVPPERRNTGHIHLMYPHLTDPDCIYIRLDDDICYLDPDAIVRLVEGRILHEKAFLVYPTIFNNTRMSYMLQRDAILPAKPEITNHFLDPIAWRSGDWAARVHDVALPAAREQSLHRLALSSRTFGTRHGIGALDPAHGEGRISVNAFAIWGRDMVQCQVTPDEEGYLADKRPRQLERGNAVAFGSAVVHFSYHCQPGLEERGYLDRYRELSVAQG